MRLILRQERIKRGWTQDYVAQKCGVSCQTVCDWENSRRKPSFDVLVKLLDLFEINDPRTIFAEAKEEGIVIEEKVYTRRVERTL